MKKDRLFLPLLTAVLAFSFLTGCNKTPASNTSESPINPGPFTILWNNYDGKLLERDINVKAGTLPTYDGNIPYRLDDENNYYVFSGWDQEIAPASEDVIYTAQYEAHPLGDVEENPDGYIDQLNIETSEGNIFHAFCWTYKQIIDKLPDLANAGFKSIQTMPVQQPKSSGASWWAFYQPLSFTIADNSKLGTKDELIELCSKAETYGISIIADIVFNHLANISDNDLEEDGTPKVSPQVANYEPYIYEHRNDATNPTFHHMKNSGSITQYYPYGGLPDLNTGNEYVQERCLALLKECIDAGIDGFRFDAAKHIETPDDAQYPSDFWPNTLGIARNYYFEKTGRQLFAYGEILNETGESRPLTNYTKLMAVTDNSYGAAVYGSLSGSTSPAAGRYHKTTEPNNLVTWVESHDTYCESKSHVTSNKVMMGYAMVATRRDSRALYLARPDANISVGNIGEYTFESNVLGAINRFHNRFAHAEEYLYSKNAVFVNQRVGHSEYGAVIVNLKGQERICVGLDNLPTGVYYDQITGEAYTIRDGHLIIKMPSSGVVILTSSKNLARPQIETDNRGGAFVNDLTVNFTALNGSGKYYVNGDENPVEFASSTAINVANLIDSDGKALIKVVAYNEQFSLTRSYLYQKISLIEGKFNVINIKSEYIENNQLYMWSWSGSTPGHWSKDFTFQDGVLLVDTNALNLTGFIIAVVPVGYTITNVNSWDDHVISQTTDISANILEQGYYDASDL